MYVGRLVALIKFGWVINCAIMLIICAVFHTNLVLTTVIILGAVGVTAAYLYRYMPLLHELSKVTSTNVVVKRQMYDIVMLVGAWFGLFMIFLSDAEESVVAIATIIYMLILLGVRQRDKLGILQLAAEDCAHDTPIGPGCR